SGRRPPRNVFDPRNHSLRSSPTSIRCWTLPRRSKSCQCAARDQTGFVMICEICVDSIAGVRAAKAAGAQRVELCANLLEGGITPSRGMIHEARRNEGVGLHVIIRPRGGDFLFDDDEFAIQRADIEAAKAERAD